MWKTFWLVFMNILFGNALLFFSISSSWFMRSILLHFSLYFHVVLTILIFASMASFLRAVPAITKPMWRLLAAFLYTFTPVVLSCWLVIGFGFCSSGKDLAKGLSISLTFGTIVAIFSGIIYWLPFLIFNFILSNRMIIKIKQ